MFPKHDIVKDSNVAKKNILGYAPKMIGLVPLSICEFFSEMYVIQLQSRETKEYIYGIYLNNKLVGHCYFGTKYTYTHQLKIINEYMPPEYDQAKEYSLKHSNIWYSYFAPEQYAWIYQKVITKIN
ncbi:hypothetical protein [Riemerella columbina]|uniref:hypothetical protein n=1 Tax=Riemerella columbina TaxID=103810 RepID=UPI000370F754|nr:hypothetical protein [Riemerella columbina]